MASANGAWANGNQYYFRAKVTATVTYTSDTVATIKVTAQAQGGSSGVAINYGQSRLRHKIGSASWVTDGTWYPVTLHGATTKTMATDSFTVSRTTSNQTVQVEHWFSSPNSSTPGYSTGSTATVSLTVSARPEQEPTVTAPNAPTGVSATRSSDTTIVVKWTNHPTTGAISNNIIEVCENDEEWVQITGSASGTATSYTWSGAGANSKYQFRVISENSAGESPASSASAVVYTTPAAPTGALAQRLDSTCYLTAILGNTRYPGTIQWQYSSNNSSWSTISNTGAATTYSTSSDLYYRCRVGSVSGGLYSAYGPSVKSEVLPRIYVNVPSGSTMKAVYINK